MALNGKYDVVSGNPVDESLTFTQSKILYADPLAKTNWSESHNIFSYDFYIFECLAI